MIIPLLSTKLHSPPPRPGLIVRPRLLERLYAGLWSADHDGRAVLTRRLTLISAPAGSGKTTLAAGWLRSLTSDQVWRGAWLSLDEDDNDAGQFFRYLIAALETAQPDMGRDVQDALRPGRFPLLKSVMTRLINCLAAAPFNVVLVLDDYHVITEKAIHDAMVFLLDHMPDRMHLVVTNRTDPPWPLARLRARHQVEELRAADLNLTPDEAAAFLNQTMGLCLSAQDVRLLESRTEGWISGLQLAALSIRAAPQDTLARVVDAFDGSHHQVVDYLAAEVLDRQPAEQRDLMCCTAILERLSGPLCDAVTGRRDGQRILRQMARDNLFLVPLDESDHWYRYHHLFADFLRHYVQEHLPERVADLHRRAADWYEQQGMACEAIGHALQIADWERAARLIEQIAQPYLMQGQAAMLLGWAHALPTVVIANRPYLCVLAGWAMLITGDWEHIESLIQTAERHLAQSDITPAGIPTAMNLSQHITAIRVLLTLFQGDPSECMNVVLQIAQQETTADPFLHSIINWLLGFVYYIDQDLAFSDRLMTQTLELCHAIGNVFLAQVAIFMAGMSNIIQGRLHQAHTLLEQGLELGGSATGERYATGASLIYQGLGLVLREWNNIPQAIVCLHHCIAAGQQWGNVEVLVDGYIATARAHMAWGRLDQAQDALDAAQQYIQEGRIAVLTVRQVDAYQAQLWIAQNRLDAAGQWAAAWQQDYGSRQEGGIVSLFVQGLERITLARLYLARDEYARVLDLITPALTLAEQSGAWGMLIELLAVQSVAHWLLKQSDKAQAALSRALSLAQPEGHVRAFVDLGEPMCQLLLAVRDQQDRATQVYLDRLLTATQCQERDRAGTPPIEPLEPVSEREMQVLRLIADGLSNQDIAGRLFVSLSTVKTHINNLYRKLDVTRRTQAIARASELGLLTHR